MRIPYARFLSDATHCPMVTSKSVGRQCLVVDLGPESVGVSLPDVAHVVDEQRPTCSCRPIAGHRIIIIIIIIMIKHFF